MALLDFLDTIWEKITDFLSTAMDQIGEVENVKQIVKDDIAELIESASELVAVEEDIEEKIRTLKTRVIRADTIYKLVDEIRTGELKQFAIDQMKVVQSSLDDSLSEVIATVKSLQVFKSGPSGFLDAIRKVYTVWTGIAKVVHALHGILPVLQKIEGLLREIDGIVLSHGKAKTTVTKHYRERTG